MKIGSKTPLGTVAMIVGDALRRHGIRGVLTGGACAAIRSGGDYVSRDVDFVVPAETPLADLDDAMASVGFARMSNRYVHDESPYFVEFPAGPLAVGKDHTVKPVLLKAGARSTWALSPADSCRDRLAAFFHWNDRQALQVAIQIALKHRLPLRAIREWSVSEDKEEAFDRFGAELRRAGPRRGRRGPPVHR